MPDPKQLPSLLKLLDDDSPVVRRAVLRELTAYGADLESEIERLAQPIDAHARQELERLLNEQGRTRLKQAWPQWQRLRGDKERLEAAHTLLSDYQNGRNHARKLGASLDALAAEYRRAEPIAEALSLVRFLFVEKALSGARTDYYSPRHSNLVAVLEDQH